MGKFSIRKNGALRPFYGAQRYETWPMLSVTRFRCFLQFVDRSENLTFFARKFGKCIALGFYENSPKIKYRKNWYFRTQNDARNRTVPTANRYGEFQTRYIEKFEIGKHGLDTLAIDRRKKVLRAPGARGLAHAFI